MKMAFLFWLNALYTLALFGVQVAEFVTAGHFQIHVHTANAFYLALLSSYVGGKEIQRWKTVPCSPLDPWRLAGEWFVGLWAVFLLIAVLGSEIWPSRLAYPQGLTLIAFEVLGFYIGSGASKWLNKQMDEKEHEQLQTQLEQEKAGAGGLPPSGVPKPTRISKKRSRYEQMVLDSARSSGRTAREQTETLLNLSRAAANRLLSGMVERGLLIRRGDPNSPATFYQRP